MVWFLWRTMSNTTTIAEPVLLSFRCSWPRVGPGSVIFKRTLGDSQVPSVVYCQSCPIPLRQNRSWFNHITVIRVLTLPLIGWITLDTSLLNVQRLSGLLYKVEIITTGPSDCCKHDEMSNERRHGRCLVSFLWGGSECVLYAVTFITTMLNKTQGSASRAGLPFILRC